MEAQETEQWLVPKDAKVFLFSFSLFLQFSELVFYVDHMVTMEERATYIAICFIMSTSPFQLMLKYPFVPRRCG